MKFTSKADVELATLPPGVKDKTWFDETLPGFGLRLRSSGRRCWVVQYDNAAGVTRRMTLGTTTVLSPAIARERAKNIFAKVRLGADPAADKRYAVVTSVEQRAANKGLAFLREGVEPGGYLYRHYDPSGDLLYVGITLAPLRRQTQHTKTAAWRDMICRIVIEPFKAREGALAAEEIANRTEFPKYNIIHNKHRHPFQELRRRHLQEGE